MNFLWHGSRKFVLRTFGLGTPTHSVNWLQAFTFFIFTITLIAFMSRIAWYDLRTIYARAGDRLELGAFFYAWATTLLPSLLFLPFIFFNRRTFSGFTICYLVLLIHTVVTGIYMGNQTQYILQELLKYTLMISAFALTVNLGRNVLSIHILTFVAKTIFFYGVFRIILFLAIGGSSVNFLWGTSNEVFAFSFLMTLYVYVPKGIRTLVANPSVPGAAILSLIGQKRTLILCFAVGVLLTIAGLVTKAKIGKLLLAVIAALAVATIALSIISDESVRKLTATDLEFETSGESRRAVEVQIVVESFRAEPGKLILGFGGGASFFLPGDLEVKGRPEVHSLHNTLAAMIYRHGVLGIFIFFYTIFYGIFWTIRRPKDRDIADSVVRRTIFSYKILILIAGQFVFGVVDDMLLAVLAGIIYREKRRHEI